MCVLRPSVAELCNDCDVSGGVFMYSFSISSRGLPTVQVTGPNWVVALGLGLEEIGQEQPTIERLACERLPNGTVIARDITTGTGYIVQQVEAGQVSIVDESEELVLSAPPDTDEQLNQISDARTPLSACHMALALACQLIPAESGAIILAERGYLNFVSTLGPHSDRLQGVRLPRGSGVAGFVVEHARPVVVADAQSDPRHCGEVDGLTGYVTRGLCAVPVVNTGRVVGVLELMNLAAGHRFDSSVVERVTEIAEVLAERLAS